MPCKTALEGDVLLEHSKGDLNPSIPHIAQVPILHTGKLDVFPTVHGGFTTDEVGSALARVGQCRLEATFTTRHWGQVTAHQVTH